jgi:hypothetical protein
LEVFGILAFLVLLIEDGLNQCGLGLSLDRGVIFRLARASRIEIGKGEHCGSDEPSYEQLWHDISRVMTVNQDGRMGRFDDG